MLRVVIILLCILNVFAYPTWFDDYMSEHDKKYSTEEKEKAFRILEAKYSHIDMIHFANPGFKLRLRSNSDKIHKPSRRLYEMKNRANVTNVTTNEDVKKKTLGLPLTFDWRTHGTVTAVENQGTCGGCYCFSAVHNLEHWYKKKTDSLQKLSIQECLDCTKQKIKDADGCDGGLMEDLFNLATRWPLQKDNKDPFKMRNDYCPLLTPVHGIKVRHFKVMSDQYNSPIEDELAHNLIKYGPIPVGVDSKSMNFELYHKGILKARHCGKEIDHAVTVVGYGIEHDTRYWIIKNSWGKKWGENGYFRLERDTNACGINSYSSFATDVEVV